MRAGRFLKSWALGAGSLRMGNACLKALPGGAAAPVLVAALLAGCGDATLELARGETEAAARRVAELRDAAPAPRFSAIRSSSAAPGSGSHLWRKRPGARSRHGCSRPMP